MDEASRLIANLQDKLRDLDHKVLLYRRDMAAEFTKHTENVLRDVPPDVSAAVTAAVAESMLAYPSLLQPQVQPGSDLVGIPEIQLNQSGSEITREVTKAKEKSKLGGKAEELEEVPRSPHARENEFLGVFTQGYLPLLDSSDKHERRSSSEATPTQVAVDKIEQPTGSLSASYSPPSISPRKMEPRRRNTDDSGTMSDPEGGPVRRSALRRSSSSGKSHSLRRVRFEFAGKEFPTTSSPSVAETSLLPTALDAMPNTMPKGDDEDEAELEQVEDIDDEPALPRRISSSQALRMLSRGPIEDDGTQWDEVHAPADGSASVSISDAGMQFSDDEEEFINMHRKKSPSPQSSNGTPTAPIPIETATTPRLDREESEVLDAEAAEEEDILSEMTPLAPMHSTRTMVTSNASSPSIPINDPSNNTTPNTSTFHPSASTPTESLTPKPAASARETKTPKVVEKKLKPKQRRVFDFPTDSEEDDFFAFEDASGALAPRPARAPSPAHSDEDEGSSSSSAPDSPERSIPPSLSAYATSPARTIGGGAAKISPAVHDHAPVVGSSLKNSYHPFQTPIVSPAVHEAALRMGEVSSFVGSVRGTTGMDEWDGKGFSGSFGGGSLRAARGGSAGVRSGSLRDRGAGGYGEGPRSFSERLALEDWGAEREEERKKNAK